MSELKVDKITPRQGTTLTLGDSGDTINFGSGVLPNFENLTVTGDLTVDTNSLKVDSTNNFVGIGTATPAVALDVVGAITATGNITGTLATAAQPNITSVGTLTSATVSGDLTVDTNTLYVNSTNNRVGIGTSSPTEKLEVSGNTIVGNTLANNQIKIIRTTTNPSELRLQAFTSQPSIDFHTESGGSQGLKFISENTTEVMRITSSGNVGIGTSSPSAKLTVIEDVSRSALTGTGVGQIHISGGTTPADNDVSSITFSTNNTTTSSSIIGNQLTNNGSNLFFGTSSNYGSGVTNTAMFINYSGNVGVGTTPSAWGSPFLSGVTQFPKGSIACESNGIILFNNAYYDGTNYKYIASAGAGSYAQTSGLHIFNVASSGTAGNNITFSEAMRIDSSGHVGVGTSSLPRTLNIYGASNGTIGLDNPVSGSPQIAFKQNGTDKAYVSYWDAFDTLALSDGSGNGLHFKPSTGNVGIGTTSPSFALSVSSTSSNTITAINTASNISRFCFAENSTPSNTFTNIEGDARSNGYMAFRTNDTERMRIDSSGKVIIAQDYIFAGSGETISPGAWVKFTGTGTVTINDDFNVSSISDVSSGQYDVNFSTACQNASYAVTGTSTASNHSGWNVKSTGIQNAPTHYTVASIRITTENTDSNYVSFIAFGDWE